MDKELKKSLIVWMFYICGGLILLALLFLAPLNKIGPEREVTVEVTGKDVKNYSNQGKYLVFTKDSDNNIEVFEVTDSLLAFRFNSSDVYAGIDVGKTYKLTVRGYRNALLSLYPNIYKYEEITLEK